MGAQTQIIGAHWHADDYRQCRRFQLQLHADLAGEQQSGADTFTYTVKDAEGNTNTSTLSFAITDDAPKANAFTASDTSGQTVTSTATTSLFGASNSNADKMGADGPSGGNVVGVEAGSHPSDVVTTGAGAQIAGTYGTLTLNQNGTYSYAANPDTTGLTGTKTDTFTYTIKDGDGSTATSTLTFNVNEVHPTANTATGTVYEAGLPTIGSGQGPTTIVQTGTLSFSEAGGGTVTVTSVNGQGVAQTTANTPITGAHGTLQINENGTYTYTLTSPESGNTTPDTFTYTVADANGNTTTSTLTITIVDDAPKANAFTASDTAGATETVNVFVAGDGTIVIGTADKSGADSPATVTGIALGDNTSTAATLTSVNGADGTLSIVGGELQFVANSNAQVGNTDISPTRSPMRMARHRPRHSPSRSPRRPTAIGGLRSGAQHEQFHWLQRRQRADDGIAGADHSQWRHRQIR